jgi:hypothetical protein
MANWFVRSGAAGTASGADWTNAKLTIAAAITAAAAGDTYFIADDHAETSASSISLGFKGGITTPDLIVCVDHTIASPGSADLKTTGQVTTTGTAASISLNGGHAYVYGIKFSCGTGASTQGININNSSTVQQVYDSCQFILAGTGSQSTNVASGINSRTRWTNCIVSFGAAGSTMGVVNGSGFEWTNTASAVNAAGTIPTTLFGGTNNSGTILIEGVDLSALGSGKTLVGVAATIADFTFKECKLGSAVTIASAPSAALAYVIDVVRCDSGNTNYRTERHIFFGDMTTETTIVRTGGASDGTTAFSFKVVTTANTKFTSPFNMPAIAIWNDTVGSSVTVTVEGIASAVPNNDEVYMEVEYMGDTASPQASRSTTRKALLATAAANTTSTQTWGGALTGKFKMAVTITPQQKGPITAYVRIPKTSATVYIDPMITLT